jgi:alkylhydroperoxidase family enzyme
MGHCEMLLAVAGLSDDQVKGLTKRLAEGDWSEWTPAERQGFLFARKLSLTPQAVGPADVRELVRQFGRERAADVVWWASRCHFMTRVADALQLPLETENVFKR